MLLCDGRWRRLLWIACSSGRAVVKKTTLPGALVAVVAAEVGVPVLPTPALRRGVVPTTDLAEDLRARVARAAQRRARHVPVGSARVQPWVLIWLLPRHLIDERRLLMLLLRLEVANGCWLGWLLTPELLLLLLQLLLNWLLLLSLLTAVAASTSTIAIACSWSWRSRCCLILSPRCVA